MQIHEKLVNGKYKKAKRKKYDVVASIGYYRNENNSFIPPTSHQVKHNVPSWVLSALHEIQCVSLAIDTVIQLQCVCEISGFNAQEIHYKKRGE